MPIIQNTDTSIGSGIDAATFLNLLQDPKTYAAKLAEFKAAQQVALDAQAQAEAAYTLVGKAEEINDLHGKAKADRQAASDALNKAHNEAAQVTADAKVKVDALTKESQAKIDVAQEIWLEKAKELDAREAAISAKEVDMEARISAARQAKTNADSAASLAAIAKVNSDNATKLAQDRLELLNAEFAKFIEAVK